MSNELDLLELDLLTYPEVVELRSKLSNIVNCSFKETLSNYKEISYSSGVTLSVHNKSLKIIKNILETVKNKLDILILTEKYLAQNIVYDDEATDRKNRVHFKNGKKQGLSNGTNSAYNGLMLGSCVCEGYTRSMQYLLKVLNIKTKNVYCIGGKDRIKVNENNYNQIILPDDGYHSIIRVEINNNFYYCDPCWDSCLWHSGDQTLSYCLKNREDIERSHSLSFEEDNISIKGQSNSISQNYIKAVCERSNMSSISKSNSHKR